MNLKHLFFLAVAGTLAVACSEVNEILLLMAMVKECFALSVRATTVSLHD